jgi:hypothetical protein
MRGPVGTITGPPTLEIRADSPITEIKTFLAPSPLTVRVEGMGSAEIDLNG